MKNVKKLLEKMIDGKIWEHENEPLDEFIDDDRTLSNYMSDLDDGKVLIENPDDIDVDKCRMITYGVDCKDDDRCVSAFIVVRGEIPLAFGYCED